MAREDKLLGVRDGTRVFGAYCIDYDSTEDIRFDDNGDPVHTGAAKSPSPDHPGHPVKDGYQRKVVVEDAQTRDEITAVLDEMGIGYVVEDISPTQDEKNDIEDYGAETGVEAADAAAWAQALRDEANGDITMRDVMRGENPHRNESFDRPGRSRPKSSQK